MPDPAVRACPACSKPIAEHEPVRAHQGRPLHLGCWWRQQLPARLEAIDAATRRAQALRTQAQLAIRNFQAGRARRFRAAPPPARRAASDGACVVCGQAIRSGAPGYRAEDATYHVACWEQPTRVPSWLLLGVRPAGGASDAAAERAPWDNPRSPAGDPVCLLCGEAIEAAEPAVHVKRWLAHGACWEPPLSGWWRR